jgi:hypothetical protein
VNNSSSAIGPGSPGASEEVLRHHWQEHRRHCSGDGSYREFECIHGNALAMTCQACNQPVYVAVMPGKWCECVASLLAGS